MIYTAITGGKDAERDDIKVFRGTGQFTNPLMEAKKYKVLPHKYMDSEISIWVDGNVYLKQSEDFYKGLLKDTDIAVLEHPLHQCVYKEAEFCKQTGKGVPEEIDELMDKYTQEGYPENNGLAQCCMIVRRHTPEINALNEAWWAEITRYSSRDQLSFPYIFRDKVKYLKHDKTKPWNIAHDNNLYFLRYPHSK